MARLMNMSAKVVRAVEAWRAHKVLGGVVGCVGQRESPQRQRQRQQVAVGGLSETVRLPTTENGRGIGSALPLMHPASLPCLQPAARANSAPQQQPQAQQPAAPQQVQQHPRAAELSSEGLPGPGGRMASPFAAMEVQQQAAAQALEGASGSKLGGSCGATPKQARSEQGKHAGNASSVDRFDFLSKLISEPADISCMPRSGEPRLLRFGSVRLGPCVACCCSCCHVPTASQPAAATQAHPRLLGAWSHASPPTHTHHVLASAAMLLPTIDWDVPEIKPSGNLDALLPAEASMVLLNQQRAVSSGWSALRNSLLLLWDCCCGSGNAAAALAARQTPALTLPSPDPAITSTDRAAPRSSPRGAHVERRGVFATCGGTR